MTFSISDRCAETSRLGEADRAKLHGCDSIRHGWPKTTVGKADAALDERLNDELGRFNAVANPEFDPAAELTVRVQEDGDLVAGLSGWTWGQAAGIAMTWVHEHKRGTGIGARLIAAFEDAARKRGCTHVFVTSFTFQAPGFYQRLGYEEIFCWESVPATGRDDVHDAEGTLRPHTPQ